MSNTVKDLAAGTAGGLTQVLVGQPFDIVKVRMQTAPRGTYSGMLDCASGILKNEGPLAFYKGTVSPLVGIGVCVSIQFGVLEACKRHYTQSNLTHGLGGPEGKLLNGQQLLLSGALAGVCNGFVSGPVEHLRIRLQTQSAKNPLYSGPLDAIKKISSEHGIKGLFKGQTATFTREGVGFGIYFWTYEALMQREMQLKNIRREQIPASKAALYGGISGITLWSCIYPIDLIKSRMQTDGFGAATGRRYSSTIDCVRQVWKEEGFRAFTRGAVPTFIRAPFANAATFLGFELAMRVLYR